MVDITVEYLNAVKIKLGSEEVSVSESAYRRNYTFDDYLLKTGTNKLVIQVTGTGGTVKRNLTINCISTFIPNTEYITEMPATENHCI